MSLRPYDYAVFLGCVLVIVAFSAFALDRGGPGGAAEIRSDDGVFLYALGDDRIVPVGGPLGDSVIRIEAGRARFVESPCRDKICIAAGHLDAGGQWAACLPNRVFLTVVGETGLDVPDATAY